MCWTLQAQVDQYKKMEKTLNGVRPEENNVHQQLPIVAVPLVSHAHESQQAALSEHTHQEKHVEEDPRAPWDTRSRVSGKYSCT